jgi:hypothetical protein
MLGIREAQLAKENPIRKNNVETAKRDEVRLWISFIV